MPNQALGLLLRAHGFELLTSGRLQYWCRPPRAGAADASDDASAPPPPPLVMLHGVLGLLPYASLLRQMAALHDGAVLVPLFPHCSIALEHLCSAVHPTATHTTHPPHAMRLPSAHC